jgi:16S rRNA A1518/A1519 N6-dimethyltransferase RsmA/KsgA/DIM1 with predicted DNA glycosylase/AP lyase activity
MKLLVHHLLIQSVSKDSSFIVMLLFVQWDVAEMMMSEDTQQACLKVVAQYLVSYQSLFAHYRSLFSL